MNGINIVLLGIDGSGKSTISNMLQELLTLKGYTVKVVPFHKWVFADILRDNWGVGKIVDRGRTNRSYPFSPNKRSIASFLKPPIAFIDNIIFYLMNKARDKDEIVIFDRFISATQIKLYSLNYHTMWFKFLWWNFIIPKTFILDVNIEDSIETQKSRNDEYVYSKEGLKEEKKLYLQYGSDHGFSIISKKFGINHTINCIMEELGFLKN